MARRVAHPRREGSRRERSRLEILEAAARAMATHGYHGMSMRDLARSTGRALASFYNYFPSKEDVLYAVQTEAFDALTAAAKDAVAAARTPAERLYAFILTHLRYFAEHPEVMRVLIQEAAALPAPRRRAVRERKEAYYRLALDIVRQVVAHGCGESGTAAERWDEAELERATYCLFGMLNWTYGWYEPARHGTPAELARTVHRLALCGLVARCPLREAPREVERRLLAAQVAPLLRCAQPEVP